MVSVLHFFQTPLITTTMLVTSTCLLVISLLASPVNSWAQNEPARFYITKYESNSNYNHYQFIGNRSDYFKILGQDKESVLIGGRNAVYNLSLLNLHEQKNTRIEWESSDAHRELCLLKGKHDMDCQNYIRVYGRINEQQFMLCGTNSYKPLCRIYNNANSGIVSSEKAVKDEKSGEVVAVGEEQPADPVHVNEVEAQGRCPYNPRHSSSYVFSGKYVQIRGLTLVSQ